MPTVIDLLKQAEDHLDRFELEECYKICQQAVELEPSSCDALQMLASVMIEVGHVDQAMEVLQRAVTISPDEGFEKYLALAQLADGGNAFKYYSEAARLLKSVLASTTDSELVSQLKRQHSNIFCSAAELFLTDLCFEESAEAECESLVSQAIEADPSNPESFRIRSDLRLAQEKPKEAKESILACLALWKDLSFDDLLYPLYDQRIAMAKVLIELGLFEEATTICESLLEEDDTVLDTWYLLGVAQVSLGDDESALEALVSTLALMIRLPADDVDLEQKESIFKFLGDMGVDAGKIWADLDAEVQAMQAASAQ